MRCCDDLPGASGVVVAEVLGDDGTRADEVVVLVEQAADPGELCRAGLGVLSAGGGTPLARAARLAASLHHLLRAVLPPNPLRAAGDESLLWSDAFPTNHRQVCICAGL